MGYLINGSQLIRIEKSFQPAQLQSIGSNPLSIFTKQRYLPLYIALRLTTGTTPYDFGIGDIFCFVSDLSNSAIFLSNSYPLQTIQNDETVICTPNEANAFKISKLGDIVSMPYTLQLTTITGLDATQGDGILNVIFYGLPL